MEGPVPCGGLRQSYVEALAGLYFNGVTVRGPAYVDLPTWRPVRGLSYMDPAYVDPLRGAPYAGSLTVKAST